LGICVFHEKTLRHPSWAKTFSGEAGRWREATNFLEDLQHQGKMALFEET
jgi:hypothetical protein